MTNQSDQATTAQGVVALIILGVLGYTLYSMVFPSDRSQIESCITAAEKMDTTGLMTGDFATMRRELNRARVVEITNRPPNNVGIIKIRYRVDGQPRTAMCPK